MPDYISDRQTECPALRQIEIVCIEMELSSATQNVAGVGIDRRALAGIEQRQRDRRVENWNGCQKPDSHPNQIEVPD